MKLQYHIYVFFISGVISSVEQFNDKTNLEVELLILLCRLVDGYDHTFKYEGIVSHVTPLEDALLKFSNICHQWKDYTTEPEKALLVIKRQVWMDVI